MDREQLGLVWMAAFAFNMGIGAREDRDPEHKEELDNALSAMRELFDITIK